MRSTRLACANRWPGDRVESRPCEVAALDAIGQAELVRRGEVSPVELVTWAIERIEQLNPTLNAVVTPMFDQALAEAAAAADWPVRGSAVPAQGSGHGGSRSTVHRRFGVPSRLRLQLRLGAGQAAVGPG